MNVRQVLVPANKPIEHVWFPEGGVTSVVTDTADNGQVEVGIFGRDGFAGTPLLLGANTSPHEVFIQVNGHTGLRIEAAHFLAAVDASVTLRTTLLRFVQTFIIQTAHSAVSNAHQRIEARLARWLLMCHDRSDGDEIALTHEFMGMMIAAERSGVTISLHVLEGAGMIRSKRGRVLILDRAKLEELAGDGYGRPEAEYRKLIAPFGKDAPRVAQAV
jgi:CRP-like cAMP-binding protein